MSQLHWSIPSRIIWGDTLRLTVNQQWENIHWHRVGEPLCEKFKAVRELLETPPPKDPVTIEGRDSNGEETNTREDEGGQQAWDFDL